MRRVTRGLKSAVQQQMVEADAAVPVPVEKTPPLEVDRDKLKVLHHRVYIEAVGAAVVHEAVRVGR